MRQVVARVLGVVFVFGTQAFANQAILLRIRPLVLEEGVTEIYESHEVDIDDRRAPHALQLQFKSVVRNATRQSGRKESTVGVLGLAAEMTDEAWKALLAKIEAKVETLDSESFRANWVGFEPRLGGDDAWTALLDPQTEYIVVVCFTPADGGSTAARFMSKMVEEPSGEKSRRVMKSTYPAERSQGWCAPLDGSFTEAPVKTFHTMPATLEERVERLVVAEVDELQARATAKLPEGASWVKATRSHDANAATRQSQSGTRPVEPGGGNASPGEGKIVNFEKVERLLATGEDGQDSWITATATDAEIPTEELVKTRLLGFRFWQEASIVQGGVMPVGSKDASDPGVRLLVGIFPDGPVEGAKRSAFLKSVAERVDQSRSEITIAELRDATVRNLGTLALDRSFVIVCHEDQKGKWTASCHVDQAKAKVLNPIEVCRALNQRLPLD